MLNVELKNNYHRIKIPIYKMTEGNVSGDSNQGGKVDLDKILVEEIGEGKYQARAIALCGVLTFSMGLTFNSFIFFAERVKTRCKIQECEDQDFNFSTPWLADAVPAFGQTFDSCHRFAPSNSWNGSVDPCLPSLFNKSSIVECTEYVYQHHNSAVYEFDLACDDWRWFLFGSSMIAGMTISEPLTGFISDRWGRRISLSIAAINFAWINVTRYWVNSFNIFILITFLGGVFGSSATSSCHLLALELVSPKRRMVVASILATCLTIGSCVKGLVAWTQPYWRGLIVILYSPLFISISYFWIAPESVRWLISKGRLQEARDLLIKAANMNGRVLSDKTAKTLSEGSRKSALGGKGDNLVCLLFKHKIILLRCIVICIWTLSTALMSKGMVISSLSIAGNKYVNFTAVAAVTIPGLWTATFLINKCGRKPLLLGLFGMTGVCQLGCIFVTKEIRWLNLALYMLAHCSTSAVSKLTVVYTAEVLPTSHRSRLSGFMSISTRVGGLAGLLTPALADRVWEHLPHALFSAMAFLCSLLVLLTPETLGVSLPETMDDAAQLGNNQFIALRKLRRRFRLNKFIAAAFLVNFLFVLYQAS